MNSWAEHGKGSRGLVMSEKAERGSHDSWVRKSRVSQRFKNST